MKWHCGLLDERPDQSRTLQWIKRGAWNSGLPEDVDRELRIWLAMPGFPVSYHIRTLGNGRDLIHSFRSSYEDFKAEVAENWLSATRDDCRRLAELRPANSELPLICKLAVLDEVKAGMNAEQLAKVYRVDPTSVRHWRSGHLGYRRELPEGFKLIHP